ncbi:MAG: M6 family metalloprotease domain-containing protein, partial [Aggregatilineaceae bacterium]
MTSHRLLSSGAAIVAVTILLASLARSWVAAAPIDLPARAELAQATPITPVKPPLPGGRQSPLRVMVPTDETWRALQAAGITDITQISPHLDPIASFSPGPRVTLFPGRPAGEAGIEAMPPTPFRTLAILVQFTDKPAQVSAGPFDTLLFGTGPATVRGYYREVSYGLLDIITLNLPSAVGWRTAPQTYSYYVNGQSCLGSYPRNCQRLTEDVVALVDPVVDFSRYDNNGDGYVDTVFIIHSGTGAEASGGSGNIIWSHSWWTYNEPYVDGVWVGSYTTEPEFWYSPGDMTHGVYVHELGHAFGLPDLYDTDYSSQGVGDWSLMSGGSWNGYLGNSPAHLDAWSRVYLDFNPVTDLGGFSGTIVVPNVEQNRDNAIYRLSSGKPNEYWLLENRQKIGSDAALPGSGLLIWHIDDNLVGSNRYECRQVNNYLCGSSHFRVALEQADSMLQLEYNVNPGDAGDPFPGSANKTAFNFTTNPNSSSYYSSMDWGVQLSNISVSDGTITADVGNPSPHLPPTLLSPADGSVTNDNTPTFSWGAVTG